MSDIYLNEKFIGTIETPAEFISKVKEERRRGRISQNLNIYHDTRLDEIYLDTSKGRPRRPVIIVENGKSKLTEEHIKKLEKNELKWQDLINEGIVEYVDAAEEDNLLIALNEEALTKDHTHLEISPLIMLGPITSIVPYANFVQSARLIRGTKATKQALGLYASNFLVRNDTDTNILHYPQKPIVRSFVHDVVNFDKHPAGQNMVIAIMSYKGYNMSDAIILNKSSIERGIGRSTFYRPYSAEELRYSGGFVDEVCIPPKDVKGYRAEKDYSNLEEDGIVHPDAIVKEEDVIIGKVSPPRFLGELEEFRIASNVRRESSTSVKHGEGGIVDFIIITENQEGNKFIEVRLRDQRIAEVGDKFTAGYGQKGVIGAIIANSDMPFTASGITPDLIFSPHSLPSRMTISYLIQIIAGKVGALNGRYIDGTTFDAEPEAALRKELLELGFRENGTEKMYNGITGEEFEAVIYVGNMYYMKLKHMVANKMHARASGRIQLLTRQPIEGRAKGGGLRLGEMEKDCFVAHGASLLLKERFDSDKTVIHICENCGALAIYDSNKEKGFCQKCGNNVEISAVELSYGFKLLIDELKSLCINPKLYLKSKYED